MLSVRESLEMQNFINDFQDKREWMCSTCHRDLPFGSVCTCQGSAPVVKPKESRVVDPVSGGEKGTKIARFSLIPSEFLWALAEHYGKGAKKYADRNWERGYKWSLTVDALQRHLHQWLLGEDNDPETGSSHLVAVAWHAIALFIFQLRGLGTDDLHRRQSVGVVPQSK